MRVSVCLVMCATSQSYHQDVCGVTVVNCCPCDSLNSWPCSIYVSVGFLCSSPQSYYQDVCGGQGGVTQVPLRDRYAPRWSDAPDLADAYIYREYVSRADQVGLPYTVTT